MKALIVEKKTDGQASYNRAKSAQDSAGHKHEVGPDFVGSGFHPPERFVPLLAKFSHPANATQRVQVFNQLQRHYGNRYVQRVVSAYRAQNAEEDEDKLASEIISEKGSGRAFEPGNQAVQRLFNPGVIQAKLRIGQPNDKYEQEADHVADQVMSTPDLRIQRVPEENERPRFPTELIYNTDRPADMLERWTWTALVSNLHSDHPLTIRFLQHYMSATAEDIELTEQEMVTVTSNVDIRRSSQFEQELQRLMSSNEDRITIDISGPANAQIPGTLGRFTVYYVGELIRSDENPEDWTFEGWFDFYDFWDFNPSNRRSRTSVYGMPTSELKVRLANAFLPGRPFHIRSVQTYGVQESSDRRMRWAASVRRPHPPSSPP